MDRGIVSYHSLCQWPNFKLSTETKSSTSLFSSARPCSLSIVNSCSIITKKKLDHLSTNSAIHQIYLLVAQRATCKLIMQLLTCCVEMVINYMRNLINDPRSYILCVPDKVGRFLRLLRCVFSADFSRKQLK